jgi:vacuolar-type H+-ATPase subunit E/Vma4
VTGPSILPAALAPVREALLAAARADAAALLADADADAAAAAETARGQAAALLAAARAESAADVETALAGERAAARRRARTTVLEARRDVFGEIRNASRAAVRTLRDEPEYARLRDALAAAARAELGAAASMVEHESGGLVAAAGGRHLDYSLDGFADRAADALGAELDRLEEP